jgi:YebC/PmpR family DNA-binding regulatory protein
MKRWSKMAKTFSRIGKDIVIAIKAGGTDPETNARLRAVMQNAKAANVPKDLINRAIKKATDKDTSDYKEVTFEGYAPHGVAIFIEAATDNNQRTVANVRSYFNKCNGSLGTTGSVAYMFDHQCHFKINQGDLDPEELELELIDFGAEEVFVEAPEEDAEDQSAKILIYGEFSNFGSIQGELENRGLEIISSGFERIPNVTKKISGDKVADVEKLLERIEDDDDVQNVFHTMVEE